MKRHLHRKVNTSARERSLRKLTSLAMSTHLPLQIELGINRERSIAYRHKWPCNEHGIK